MSSQDDLSNSDEYEVSLPPMDGTTKSTSVKGLKLSAKDMSLIRGASNTTPPPPLPTITVTGNAPVPPPPMPTPSPPPPPPFTGGGDGGGGGGGGGGDSGPSPNCATAVNGVSQAFLSVSEGGQLLNGYWPGGNSGATIATGIDLYGKTAQWMHSLNWPQYLIDKFMPYTSYHGTAARDYLSAHPLSLSTRSEADLLDATILLDVCANISTMFNFAVSDNSPDSSSFATFYQLPDEAQTAIIDLAYQYGGRLDIAAPNFWTAITTENWDAAYNELMNFGDDYPTRRHREAAILKEAMDRHEMPTRANPCT